MNSILQSEKKCFFTGATQHLHRHHVFGGANRKNSEKYGLTVYLQAELHNIAPDGNDVHHNRKMGDDLKRWAQEKAMQYYSWSIDDWMSIFHRNYL